LWVILGTVFAAGVHVFGTLVVSVRKEGLSVGSISDKLVGQLADWMFFFLILMLVFLFSLLFARFIACDFVLITLIVLTHVYISCSSILLPVFILNSLAFCSVYDVYYRKKKMLVPSLLAMAVMYIAAIMASKIDFLQIDLIRYFGGENGTGLFGLSTTGTAFF